MIPFQGRLVDYTILYIVDYGVSKVCSGLAFCVPVIIHVRARASFG